MKKNRIALYIDLLFCLVIMPLAIMLLPVDRWIAHNTAFLLTLVAYVYLLYLCIAVLVCPSCLCSGNTCALPCCLWYWLR